MPNALTAFIVGNNGERVRKLHDQTGAYIFVPKEYNTFTDERIIQVSGNERSVAQCKSEIKKIVSETAPLLGIDLQEFKATKKVIEENFKKIMRTQTDAKVAVPKKKKSLAALQDELMNDTSESESHEKVKSED